MSLLLLFHGAAPTPPPPVELYAGGGGGGPVGRVYGTVDGERVRFVLRSRVDDNEIVEILTMIINSGVLDQ